MGRGLMKFTCSIISTATKSTWNRSIKHKRTSSNSLNGYELRAFRFTWLKSTTYRLRLALLWMYSTLKPESRQEIIRAQRAWNPNHNLILPSPTSLFPTTPSSLHQSSNVPSFINLVHALARLNLWYFPSCLCESTSKWWFSSPVFSSFLTFTLDKASPVHNRPWLTESDVWFG